MKNYRNYELTQYVCKAIASGHIKSIDIYGFIKYPGTNSSFRSALSKIKKAGYIKFSDKGSQLSKNPFQRKHTYALTQKGQRFLANPNERWEKKQARLHEKIMKLLEQQPEFLKQLAEEKAKMNPEKLIEYVNSNMGTNYTDISQVNELLNKIEENQGTATQSDNYLQKLESENENLKKQYDNALLEIQRLQQQSIKQSVKSQTNDAKSLSPQKLAREEQRKQLAILRRKLAQHYYNNRILLDAQFFHQWQNIVPVKVKGAKWFTQNSVEFISKNNKEFARGHAVEMNPEQIFESQFYILKIERDGIVIGGKGIAEKCEKIKF